MQNINNFQAKCPLPVTVVGGICDRTTERTWPGSVKMSRIEYVSGQKIGECVYLYDTQLRPRKAMFQCKCGNEFETAIGNVKNNHTQSCGCLQKERTGNATRVHGLKDHPLYRKWKDMKKRCYNPNVKDYKDYGGRGIVVCEEWKNNFKAYFDYISSLENAMQPGLSIDRIRNNEGYKPGNLRWADQHIQSTNRRVMPNNTSGCTGVCYHSRDDKWSAYITIHGERIWLGYHKTSWNAYDARIEYIKNNGLIEYLPKQKS